MTKVIVRFTYDYITLHKTPTQLTGDKDSYVGCKEAEPCCKQPVERVMWQVTAGILCYLGSPPANSHLEAMALSHKTTRKLIQLTTWRSFKKDSFLVEPQMRTQSG